MKCFLGNRRTNDQHDRWSPRGCRWAMVRSARKAADQMLLPWLSSLSLFQGCVASQKGHAQGAKRHRGTPRQGLTTRRMALLAATRREWGEQTLEATTLSMASSLGDSRTRPVCRPIRGGISDRGVPHCRRRFPCHLAGWVLRNGAWRIQSKCWRTPNPNTQGREAGTRRRKSRCRGYEQKAPTSISVRTKPFLMVQTSPRVHHTVDFHVRPGSILMITAGIRSRAVASRQ